VEITPSSVEKSYIWEPQHLQTSILLELKRAFVSQEYLISIYQSLSVLNISLKERFGDEIWLDEMFFAVEVNAVFHRLLSIPRLIAPLNMAELMQETSRIAGIIYIGKIFQSATVGPWYHGPHATKIKARLAEQDFDWAQFNPIKLWILSFGALGSDRLPERDWYADHLRRLCQTMRLATWLEVSQSLFSLPWMHGMFRQRLMELYVPIVG